MDTVMKQKRMIKSILVVTAMILIITLPGSLYFTDLRIALIIMSIIWFFIEKTDMEYLWYSLIFFLSYDQHMHIPMKPTSDSGNNRPLDLVNKTGQVIIHQVDDMVR